VRRLQHPTGTAAPTYCGPMATPDQSDETPATTTPGPTSGHAVVRWLRMFVARLTADRVTGLAAELAFWSLLSLVPAAIMFVSMLGWLDAIVGNDVAAQVEANVLSAMRVVFSDRADQLTDGVQALFDSPNTALFSVAALVTLWSGSHAFATLGEALDVINGARAERPWLTRRLLGVLMGLVTLVLAVVLMAVFVVGPLFGRSADVIGDPGARRVARSFWDVARFPLAGVALLGWATALYRFAPTQRTAWRRNVVGSFVAAGLWAVFTLGFRVYLDLGGSNVIVNSLGGVLVALLWLYLMSIGLLVGAEVNRLRADSVRSR
jgi:membrane protein